jgi:hypothetical protein
MWNTAKDRRNSPERRSPKGPKHQRVIPLCLIEILCSILLSRCTPPVSFEYLDISCSAGQGEQYYFGETAALDFSIMPDKGETERNLILTEGGLSRGPVFNWEGRTLHVKPLTGWKKGEHYGISLEGRLLMEDGRTYSAGIIRNFIYGHMGNEFTLDYSAMEDNKLIFSFSKVPGVTSFDSQFSLSPGVEYFCDFLGREIQILPKSPWQANTAGSIPERHGPPLYQQFFSRGRPLGPGTRP